MKLKIVVLLFGASIVALAGPSWTAVPKGSWKDDAGCFDVLTKDNCVGMNVPTSGHQFTSHSIECLWCHSVTNNTALYHPDHCAPLEAVKSSVYHRDQMVCSYRHPNGRHKPGHFDEGKKHHENHDHEKQHGDDNNHHKQHNDKPKHDKPQHHNDRNNNNNNHKWPAPRPHGGQHMQQPRHPWNQDFNKGGEWKQFWRHNGPPSPFTKPAHGKSRPFPQGPAGALGRKLLEVLTVEDPYSGGGSGSDSNPISSLSAGLQFLAGLALGLLDQTPSSVVMCGANVAEVIEDITKAFDDFHLSASGIVSTLTDLFNAIKNFTEALKACGLEAVLEKITAFLAKYTTPIIGEILGAITITFNAIDVFDDIDDAVHSSESGDWFDVGKDIGNVIGIVA